jgi:serine protease Do
MATPEPNKTPMELKYQLQIALIGAIEVTARVELWETIFLRESVSFILRFANWGKGAKTVIPGFPSFLSKLARIFARNAGFLRQTYRPRLRGTSRRHGTIKTRPARVVALFTSLIICTSVLGCGKDKSMTTSQLVREVRESVVRIQIFAIGSKSKSELGGDPEVCQNAPASGGTGFIIAVDGHILTNNHVVEMRALCSRAWPNVPIKVYLSSNESFDATLVGRDPLTDLAVLKISKNGLRPLAFADFNKAEIGQEVVAIGFPRPGKIEGAPTVTKGIISAKERALEYLADLVQTDATINGGNSGGPLLSLQGEVVGVNSVRLQSLGRVLQQPDGSVLIDVDVSEGTNFAVSSRIAARVSSDLISKREVSRAVLGVTLGEAITDNGALVRRLQGQPFSVGILVGEVAPGTPAARILGKCDVIEQLGSYAIANIGDLNNALIWLRSGQTVKIQYRRYPPDKCTKVPEAFDPYFNPPKDDPSQRGVFRPRLSDPESFRARNFPSGTSRGGIFGGMHADNDRRKRIIEARRDEGKVLTSEITLR